MAAYAFVIEWDRPSQGPATMDRVKALKKNTLNILLSLDPSGQAYADALNAAAGPAGITIGKTVTFQPSTLDLSNQVSQMKSANPDVVYIASFAGADLSNAVKAMDELGYRPPLMGNSALGGTVVTDAVSAIVDPNRHTVPIRVRVPNESGNLRPNAFATVRFAIAGDDKALSIPATSIVSDGAKQYVYVWGDDKSFTRRDGSRGSDAGGRRCQAVVYTSVGVHQRRGYSQRPSFFCSVVSCEFCSLTKRARAFAERCALK